MAVHSAIKRSPKAHPIARGWLEAYRLFLTSPEERLGLKLLPLAIFGLVPIAIADDVLLPFVGLLDNLPTSLFVLFVVIRTWVRVRHYR